MKPISTAQAEAPVSAVVSDEKISAGIDRLLGSSSFPEEVIQNLAGLARFVRKIVSKSKSRSSLLNSTL